MLLLVGLMAGVPAFAAQQKEPHQWYVLSFQDGECHAATALFPRIASPEQFHNALRNDGIVDNIRVDKDDNGNVNFVLISFALPLRAEESTFWFPGSDKCELGKIGAKISGLLPDTSDLK
jgi:hypothetical protein